MSGDVIVAFCAVCGKEIKRGKTSAHKYEEDGLWACGLGCIGKYKKKRDNWSPKQLIQLKERQTSYDLLMECGLTQEWADKSYVDNLPEEAKDLIGDEKILGLCRGAYGLRKLRKQIIVTSAKIVIFDPKLTGVFKQVIPYEQVISAQYSKTKGFAGTFKIKTLSGGIKQNVDNHDHDAVVSLLQAICDRMSEIAGVAVSISYDKGLFRQKWSFYAPPQMSGMMDKPVQQESKQAESIPEQIVKLEELKNAGIITDEEYNKKKQELLDRM